MNVSNIYRNAGCTAPGPAGLPRNSAQMTALFDIESDVRDRVMVDETRRVLKL